ncbi:hypothetical protein Q7P35_005542 [Cladosporium inversicolor]
MYGSGEDSGRWVSERGRVSKHYLDGSQLSSSPTSSRSSSPSTTGGLTPKSTSSQEILPATTDTAVALPHIGPDSPSMEQILTSSSLGTSKRPVSDVVSGTTPHKRPKLRQRTNESRKINPCSLRSDCCPPLFGRCRPQSSRPQQLPSFTMEKSTSVECDRQDIAEPDSQMNLQHPLVLRGKPRWSGIELQPDFSPISQEQLAAEVKGIYAGLVMVEAKCMYIDAQKASQPNDELSTEQWQALIALHRTLLYEHHDFLMATQHPSATSTLLGLATKYSMPARMWKHGIHAFLEVLRHRRPHSQEYMLAFIYLAYQMVSLLLETVPGFTDTWVECLGDLARYRMAIEEDREIHTVWGGVAGRWYVKAADRHPEVGRLYHHSGILERPSLRKFYLYGRALTSIFPFLNAKKSLSTLCTPIVEDEHALRKGGKSADAVVIYFHARSFLAPKTEPLGQAYSAALAMLEAQSEVSIGAFGVPLAVTNIAALLGFGASNNVYRQLFDTARNLDTLRATSSRGHSSALQSASTFTFPGNNDFQHPAEIVLDFCYHSFNSIIQRTPRRENLPSLLPYVHVMLVFIKSLQTLSSRLAFDDNATKFLDDALSPDRLDWSALASFLNHIAKFYPISSRTHSSASRESFPTDGIPLLEDYMIRGLVWAQWYFEDNWFKNVEDDDGSRCLEDGSKEQHRAARVLYLGMILAAQSNYLLYDRVERQFSTVASLEDDELESTTSSLSSLSPRSGDDVSIESDYVMVSRPSPKQSSLICAQEAGSLKQVKSWRYNWQKMSSSKLSDPTQAAARVKIAEHELDTAYMTSF